MPDPTIIQLTRYIKDLDRRVEYLERGPHSLASINNGGGNIGAGLVSVPFTSSVPFTATTTTIGAYDMADGNLTLTPNTTGAIEGATAQILIKGDNSHQLNISAFKKIGDGAFDNADNVDYLLVFNYIDGEYCVAITLLSTILNLTQLATPTLNMSMSDTTATLTASSIANESGMRYQIAEDEFFTVNLQTANEAANVLSHQFTGLTPLTIYYGRVKGIGNGITYSDSAYGTDTDSTVAEGPDLMDIDWDGGANLGGTQALTATPKLYDGNLATGGEDGYSSDSRHLPAGEEGYFVVQHKPSLTNTHVVLGFNTGTLSGTTTSYYTSPAVALSYGDQHFYVGDVTLPGSWPGSMGYPFGTQAHDEGASVADYWYGLHAKANNEVWGCYSADGITFIDVQLIGTYATAKYPTTMTIGYPGHGYYSPKVTTNFVL